MGGRWEGGRREGERSMGGRREGGREEWREGRREGSVSYDDEPIFLKQVLHTYRISSLGGEGGTWSPKVSV